MLMFSSNIQRCIYIYHKIQKQFYGFENKTLSEFATCLFEGFIENKTTHKHKWKTQYWG